MGDTKEESTQLTTLFVVDSSSGYISTKVMSSEDKKRDRNAASSDGVIVNLGQDDELVSTFFELNINRSCLIAPQINFIFLLLLFVNF